MLRRGRILNGRDGARPSTFKTRSETEPETSFRLVNSPRQEHDAVRAFDNNNETGTLSVALDCTNNNIGASRRLGFVPLPMLDDENETITGRIVAGLPSEVGADS